MPKFVNLDNSNSAVRWPSQKKERQKEGRKEGGGRKGGNEIDTRYPLQLLTE